MQHTPNTLQKALDINLNPKYYGTIAEIGAGQEVARFFFQAGGAAGTIAKSMSAYDMDVSDAIYGREDSKRYVCRSRVETMVNREYDLLVARLESKKDPETCFFAFANTVTAQSYSRKNNCHGWIGIKARLKPHQEPSTIILHVRMLDNTNREQQDAVGILGVNLIHAIFHHADSPETLIKSLLEDVGRQRLEIDMINFDGPDFSHLDNRLMALALVKEGLTNAVIFSPEGKVLLPGEVLYKKNVLVARGSFKPITNVNLDMRNCASNQFAKDDELDEDEIVYLPEITMAELMNKGEIDTQDFLNRVDMLCEMGSAVLISNYLRFFSLRAYLNRNKTRKIGIVLGVPNIMDIFNEDFYEGLEGGFLKALGLLFEGNCRVYVYPRYSPDRPELLTTRNLKVPAHLKNIYLYLLQNKLIIPIEGANEELLPIHARHILKDILQGKTDWDDKVPELVYNKIIDNKLFGFGSEA